MDDNEGRGARLPAEITQESVESCRPSKDQRGGAGVRECCGQRGLSVKRVTTSGGASLSHISPVTHWKRLCHWLGLQPPPGRSLGGAVQGRPCPYQTQYDISRSTPTIKDGDGGSSKGGASISRGGESTRASVSPGGRGHPNWCRRSRQELHRRTSINWLAVLRWDQYEPWMMSEAVDDIT